MKGKGHIFNVRLVAVGGRKGQQIHALMQVGQVGVEAEGKANVPARGVAVLDDVVAVVDGVEEPLDHVPEVGRRLHPLVEICWPVGEVEDLLDGGELLVRGVKLLVGLHRLGLESLPALQIVWKKGFFLS